MGSFHKSLLLHTEVRWLSRGTVLTRFVELREQIAMFQDGQNDYAKFFQDDRSEAYISKLADIFFKLNELNLYLQGTDEADIFVVYDKIRGFTKKFYLWKKNIKDRN